MIVSQRVEIDPTEKQKKALQQLFGYRRFCYNRALDLAKNQINLWMKDKTVNKYPSSMILRRLSRNSSLQNDWEELRNIYVHDTAVDDAADAISRIKGKGVFRMPRYKTKRDTKQSCQFYRKKKTSFHLEDAGNKCKIFLPSFSSTFGSIRMKERIRSIFLKRESLDIIKRVTVWYKAGKYFATFFLELKYNPYKQIKKSLQSYCGVDLGIKTFATIVDDRGDTYIQESIQKKLKKLYSRMEHYRRLLDCKIESKKKNVKNGKKNPVKTKYLPDSKRYVKTRLKLQRLGMKINNCAMGLVHETTSFLCKSYKVITIEDLKVQNLIHNKKLSKAISRSFFYQFRSQMQYKSRIYGNVLIIADKMFPSSQKCSACGHILKKRKKNKTFPKNIYLS